MEKIADTNTSALIKGGLRSIAGLVPILGSFAQAWNEHEAHTRNKRLDEFFQNLRELGAAMQHELAKVKEHIEKSGEFPGLLENTVENVQRELSARKRRLYVQALLNNVAAGAGRSYDDKVNIIEMLDELTETDLRILSRFSRGAPTQVADLMVSRPPHMVPVGEEQENELSLLVVSFTKLESRGLISETKTYAGDLNWLNAEGHWASKWLVTAFQLLPFGQVFLDVLKENHPQQ